MARIVFAPDRGPGSPRAVWEDGMFSGDADVIRALRTEATILFAFGKVNLTATGPSYPPGFDDPWQALATIQPCMFVVEISDMPQPDPRRVPPGVTP